MICHLSFDLRYMTMYIIIELKYEFPSSLQLYNYLQRVNGVCE